MPTVAPSVASVAPSCPWSDHGSHSGQPDLQSCSSSGNKTRKNRLQNKPLYIGKLRRAGSQSCETARHHIGQLSSSKPGGNQMLAAPMADDGPRGKNGHNIGEADREGNRTPSQHGGAIEANKGSDGFAKPRRQTPIQQGSSVVEEIGGPGSASTRPCESVQDALASLLAVSEGIQQAIEQDVMFALANLQLDTQRLRWEGDVQANSFPVTQQILQARASSANVLGSHVSRLGEPELTAQHHLVVLNMLRDSRARQQTCLVEKLSRITRQSCRQGSFPHVAGNPQPLPKGPSPRPLRRGVLAGNSSAAQRLLSPCGPSVYETVD